MKIVVFEAAEWERNGCLRLEPAHHIRCTPERMTATSAREYADAEVITIFIGSEVSEAVLAALPNLKLIATRSTGYDHIDLEACRQRGVAVCNVPDYGDPTVAEHVFALLLAVTRRIVEAAGRTRAGDFTTEGLRGLDLAGRTIGVIGAGRIGRRVMRIALGFGMTAIALDATPDPDAAQRLGFEYVSLSELLRRADVLSLHVPGGADTRDMISDRELAQMKPGAVLINTARGGVVNAAALLRALNEGRLLGAGLDVLAEEHLLKEEAEIFRPGASLSPDRLRELVAENALIRLRNVVVTPHIAYDTQEALHRILATTLDNIEAFARGAPANLVVPSAPGIVKAARP